MRRVRFANSMRSILEPSSQVRRATPRIVGIGRENMDVTLIKQSFCPVPRLLAKGTG
jgi:hypothetical protein